MFVFMTFTAAGGVKRFDFTFQDVCDTIAYCTEV